MKFENYGFVFRDFLSNFGEILISNNDVVGNEIWNANCSVSIYGLELFSLEFLNCLSH